MTAAWERRMLTLMRSREAVRMRSSFKPTSPTPSPLPVNLGGSNSASKMRPVSIIGSGWSLASPNGTALKQHADEAGLLFLSSPFSDQAIDLLRRVGVAAWKIASGEVSNLPMLEKLAATRLACILSTGMNPLAEVDAAVSTIRDHSAPVCVLQCTTAYPCPPGKIGLNVMTQLRDRYDCPVGLSDHSGTIYPGLSAATLGASVVEVHVTLSRESFGPDVPASVTTSELCQLVEGIRFTEQMINHPVDKEAMATELAPLRSLFGKSLVTRTELTAGTILESQHLALKKPGTGIPASRLGEMLNRRVRHCIAANTILREEDLD